MLAMEASLFQLIVADNCVMVLISCQSRAQSRRDLRLGIYQASNIGCQLCLAWELFIYCSRM